MTIFSPLKKERKKKEEEVFQETEKVMNTVSIAFMYSSSNEVFLKSQFRD